MTINNIIKNFLCNIKFYLNIKTNLVYNFSIYIYKCNLNNKNILNLIKKIKYNIFNFRNKINFTKSKRNLTINKKRTGKARIGSSSSHVLRNGLMWFGFRNKKLKNYKFSNNLLNNILIYKKNLISIINLETIKFIHNTTYINFNIYNKIINKNFKDCININNMNNYYKIFNNTKFVDIVY